MGVCVTCLMFILLAGSWCEGVCVTLQGDAGRAGNQQFLHKRNATKTAPRKYQGKFRVILMMPGPF